jgi:hypothetical protein
MCSRAFGVAFGIGVGSLAVLACGRTVGPNPADASRELDGGAEPDADSGLSLRPPPSAADAGADMDVDPAVRAAVSGLCDAGYFVEVSSDAGTIVLTSACSDAGPNVPTIVSALCGEDCGCTTIRACGGGVAFQIATACEFCTLGTCAAQALYQAPTGESELGPGAWQIPALPADGGGAAGLYSATLDGPRDGSFGPVGVITGRFCVYLGPM